MKISKADRQEINRILKVEFGKRSCSDCNRVLPIEKFNTNVDKRLVKGYSIHCRCIACNNDKLHSKNRAIKLMKLL